MKGLQKKILIVLFVCIALFAFSAVGFAKTTDENGLDVQNGLVMEVREIYKISDMIHKAAGWKKENIFLFLNTIFWAVLAFVIGAAAFTLITGTIAGHGVSLFCITGYAGMIIGFFGGSYYLYRRE